MRISDWSSDVCSSDLLRVRCLMPSYTVREWDKIAHGEGEGEILLRHADKLASLAARSIFAGRGGSGVLEHGRNALRARGVVGILATSEVSLGFCPRSRSHRPRRSIVRMLKSVSAWCTCWLLHSTSGSISGRSPTSLGNAKRCWKS